MYAPERNPLPGLGGAGKAEDADSSGGALLPTAPTLRSCRRAQPRCSIEASQSSNWAGTMAGEAGVNVDQVARMECVVYRGGDDVTEVLC